MDPLLIYAIVHVASGVLAYGLVFADLSASSLGDKTFKNRLSALILGVCGPMGLSSHCIVEALHGNSPFKHGWKL